MSCHPSPFFAAQPLSGLTFFTLVVLDGYHGDNARTVGVGTVPEESAALARVCLESIEKAIEIVGPGVNYHDLATTIFECAHHKADTMLLRLRISLAVVSPLPLSGSGRSSEN